MELPKDFKDRMKNMLKEEYDCFEDALLNNEKHIGIRINPKKENAKTLVEKELENFRGVLWCNTGYYCNKDKISGKHPYHMSGMCYFQEPSAMAVVESLDIQKDDYVLDLCAAPGGKATQAGAKLSENGLLVANEIVTKRAQILSENIERMGIQNAIVTNETPQNLALKFFEFFDKIIVDAPCSGEGMFRKDSVAIDEWSINHTKTCALRQKHILDCAYKMLKPGGKLVYSTCTFAPCENEEVAEYLLLKYDDMKLCDTGLEMIENGRSQWGNSGLDLSLTKRIFPHKIDGEGHFIALFEKDGVKTQNNEKEKKQKDIKCENAVRLFKEFEKKYLNTELIGDFKLFAENLYIVPHGINLDKIKVIRCGRHLGVCKKNRFEPSHALAMSLKKDDFKNTISFDADSLVLDKYLHGDIITADIDGYVCVMVKNNPVGWAKGSQGVLKNHYPKYMRLL